MMCDFCSEPDTAHEPDCPAVTGNWSDFSDEEIGPTGYTRDVFGEPAKSGGECECHREGGSHEACCGHDEGRNPDCPLHGDGSET